VPDVEIRESGTVGSLRELSADVLCVLLLLLKLALLLLMGVLVAALVVGNLLLLTVLMLLLLLLLVEKLLLFLVVVMCFLMLLSIQRRRCDIEALIDDWRDGLDFSSKFLFNLVQIEAILVCDQVDSQTQVTKATATTDTMKIGFGVFGKVKVDNDVNGLDIDTTGQQVGADQVSADTVPEIVENSVTVGLKHLCVRVEA